MSRYLYFAPLTDFLTDVEDGSLYARLAAELERMTDHAPQTSEVASWRASLPALADVLRDRAFATGEVFVELFMPLNGKRCDVLLTGHVAEGPSAVVVELKSWSFVERAAYPEHVSAGTRVVPHPSVQVRDYVETLRHYHSAFTGEGAAIALHGTAFLHALPLKQDRAGLRDALAFGVVPQDYPVFYQHEARLLARWLAARLVPGPGKPVADRIRDGHALPSPKLLDHLVECIKGQRDWQLLDEQKTAYFAIRHAVQMARDTRRHAVFVVRGGPGTGKSVLAIQLLADAARQHWRVAHATGTKAFQTVLQARTAAFGDALMKRIHGAKTKKALPVGELFTTFASIARVGAETPDRFDLVICDEAHRLWEFRSQKYPSGLIRPLSDTCMVDEVIAASLVTVFFLDDHQSVRAGEIGRSELIVERARALGVDCERHELDAQFRCAGSASYIRWAEGVLGLRAALDHDWQRDRVYAVRLWESMAAMDAHLRGLVADRRRCRLVAGFCWRWSTPDRLGVQPTDLVDPRFGEWKGRWITKSAKELKPIENRYFHWATVDDAYDQVGSIYSVQGFEFDDVGVIWGEDLVWRTDRWVAQLERNKDIAFKRDVLEAGDDPVEKLRNVYRVLLTRGMRSTHLFVLDDETRDHLAACLAVPNSARRVVGLPDPPPAPARTLRALRTFEPRVVEPDGRWQEGVPLMDFAAAAGGFSGEWRDLVDPGLSEHWVSWDGAPTFLPGDFVARVAGDSMSGFIEDGEWCLFRPAPIEQAEGRPALVRLAGDAPDGGHFSVKDVHVEWHVDPDGGVVRSALVLRSRNTSYADMRFTAHDQSEVTVLALVIRVLGRTLK